MMTRILNVGDTSDKLHYRPISVLPVISRLFEKLVFNQLYQYIDHNGLLSPNQSGFRRVHSTVTCLLKNTDGWYSGLDSGQVFCMVFVDLKKSFGMVDHGVLYNILKSYVVHQRGLSWFKWYLFNRTQYCSVGGYEYNVGQLEVGVPQGSCLGPLSFVIYNNDLP